jgi:hypothetical protein
MKKYFNCNGKTYVRLFKCGSTSILDVLPNWEQSDMPKFDVFSVVRHPEERVKSIYKQMVKSDLFQKGEKRSFSDWLTGLIDNGFYNNHQLPQTEILKGTYPIRLFTLDNMENVMQWIGAKKRPKDNQNNLRVDVSIEDAFKISQLYNKDFLLYEHVRLCEKKDGCLVKQEMSLINI